MTAFIACMSARMLRAYYRRVVILLRILSVCIHACVLQDTRWENAAAILDAWLQHSLAIPAAKAG